MDREQLFAAVLDAPDHDAPRLVLADFLLEQGDPLGPFIALQCSGQSGEADELLESHRAEWSYGLRAEEGVYARGLLHDVTLGPTRFDQLWPELEARAPVQRLQLGAFDLGRLRRLLHGVGARRLRHLDLSRSRLGDEGASLLATSDALRGLQSLRLSDCGLSAAGATALATSTLRSLRRLDLCGNSIGEAGALALAAGLPSLESVRLFGCDLTPAALNRLEARWPAAQQHGALLCVERPAWAKGRVPLDGVRLLARGQAAYFGSDSFVELSFAAIPARRHASIAVSSEGEGRLAELPRVGADAPVLVNREPLVGSRVLRHGDRIELPYAPARATDDDAARVGVGVVYLDGPISW